MNRSSHPRQPLLKRPEIIVALIGLVGILATAVTSNWDKVFRNSVQATYSGYKPTGDFETELRYFFEVSGGRSTIETVQKQMIEGGKAELISEHPKDAEEINRIYESLQKEVPTFAAMIKELIPVYQKHFTINEIQELNKFYSTDTMRSMVKKMPLVIQDATPIELKMMSDVRKRWEAQMRDKLTLPPESDQSLAPTAKKPR